MTLAPHSRALREVTRRDSTSYSPVSRPHDADEQNERARVLDCVHRFPSVTHSRGDATRTISVRLPRHTTVHR